MRNLIKTVLFSLLILSSFLFLISCSNTDTQENVKKIGVLVPLENKALDEIVRGFKTELTKNSKFQFQFKVANAQGDLNLQRAILSQMKSEHYDIIAPIGTTATQMAVSMIKNQPILSIAANYTEQQRKKIVNGNLAVVHDEISPQLIIEFIHVAFPKLKHLTLIHSGTEKTYADVQAAIVYGSKNGIEVTPMIASTLNDLYSTAQALPTNTQGVLILKDILITSGISVLSHAAQTRQIPLIASDQGSVQDGAAIALGVHEDKIGVESAKLATRIIQHIQPRDLPIVEMQDLTLFLNSKSCEKEHLTISEIEHAAKIKNYPILITDIHGDEHA